MEPVEKPADKGISLEKLLSIHLIFAQIWKYLEFQDILNYSLVSKWWFSQSREYVNKHRICFIADRETRRRSHFCENLKIIIDLLHSRIPNTVLPFNSERFIRHSSCITTEEHPPGTTPLQLLPMILAEIQFKRIEFCDFYIRQGGTYQSFPAISARAEYVLELLRRSWDTLEILKFGRATLTPEELGLTISILKGTDELEAGRPSTAPSCGEILSNCHQWPSPLSFPKLKVIELDRSITDELLRTLPFFLRAAPNLQRIQGYVPYRAFESEFLRKDYRLLRGIWFYSKVLDSAVMKHFIVGKSELSHLRLFGIFLTDNVLGVEKALAVQVDPVLLVGVLNNSWKCLCKLECSVSQLLLLSCSDSLVSLVALHEMTIVSGSELDPYRSMYHLFLSSINFAYMFPSLRKLRFSRDLELENESFADVLRMKSRLIKSDHLCTSVKTVHFDYNFRTRKSLKRIMKVFPTVQRVKLSWKTLRRMYHLLGENFGWKLKSLHVFGEPEPTCSFWDDLFSQLKQGLEEMTIAFDVYDVYTTGYNENDELVKIIEAFDPKWKRKENGDLILQLISNRGLQTILENHPGLSLTVHSYYVPFAENSFHHLGPGTTIETHEGGKLFRLGFQRGHMKSL